MKSVTWDQPMRVVHLEHRSISVPSAKPRLKFAGLTQEEISQFVCAYLSYDEAECLRIAKAWEVA